MKDMNTFSAKSDLAYWLKYFAIMKEPELEKYDLDSFTMIQKMAYNFVMKSKTDTKVAEKVIDLIHWYEVDAKWFLG